MRKILVPLALAVALAALAARSALAEPAQPFDSGAIGTTVSLPVLPTGLFGLDTDLSAIGVDPTELATAGPQSSTDPTGNMLVVGHDPSTCPDEQYPTIQSAVDAAAPGAMIKVCPGTYVEQVLIPAGKDGLTLFSQSDLQAVIKAPPVMTSPKAIVLVQAQNVTIRHFTITGPGGGPCDSLEYGVRVDSGGSAVITDNHITQIHDTPFSGCQNGVGVLIGRNSENTYGSGTVVHNLIDNYQKGGVVVDGQLAPNAPASHAEVAYNEIDGIGPTGVIAQNGIQVSRGAIANVHHNVVTNNIYSPSAFADEAILLFEDSSPQTTIDHNDVYDNNDGIGLYTTSNIEVGWNDSHDNAPYDGLFADSDTAGNTIEYNRMYDNAEFDCNDVPVGPGTAGTANFWIQDLGYTESRPGLCKHAS
jgi:hypothetical protein